ncbi:hypothetical protein Bbelb_197620 [Branchiostoma belcheri]|nr:hypothetical protein Bbelb_197620 [Branchiostoma belcheri]
MEHAAGFGDLKKEQAAGFGDLKIIRKSKQQGLEKATGFGDLKKEQAAGFGDLKKEQAAGFGDLKKEQAAGFGDRKEEKAAGFGILRKSKQQCLVILERAKQQGLGNLRHCKNYRTISLISHPSKIMLKVLLKRLNAKAEEILAEEQAGFRAGRSTIEQILNCRLIIEKHLQHQRELHHNFIDFKKAFDRVWHEGLWWVLREFNIDESLVQTIEALYKNATSAVLLGNQVGGFFRTTVGVRQGCLLSPVLFNMYLEKIMQEALYDHHTSISIGGRRICNLRFADDIDLLGGSNAELQSLTDKLNQSAGSFGMEVSTEKSKVMVNSSTRDEVYSTIRMNGEELETVDSFTYLGGTLTRDGTSKVEVYRRIALATAAMARLTRIWKSKNISFAVKYKLYKSLVVSILLYGCETWTLLTDTERRIQAFETKSLRRLLGISYHQHKTNVYVYQQVYSLVGPQEAVMSTVRRRKLQWFGHLTRHNNLAKTILQGTLEGKRRRGRQKKVWLDNIKDWTSLTVPQLLTAAQDRRTWLYSCCKVCLVPPTTSVGKDGCSLDGRLFPGPTQAGPSRQRFPKEIN